MVARGLMAIVLLFATAATAGAAEFLLDSGDRIEGEIIAITRSTVTNRSGLGVRLVPRNDIVSVEIVSRDGRSVRGALADWSESAGYDLDIGSRLVTIRDGRILAERPAVQAPPVARDPQPPRELPPAPSDRGVETGTVRVIQRGLDRLGFSAGRTDGVLDDRTRQAIARFQRAAGLPPTGAPSEEVSAAIISALGGELHVSYSTEDRLVGRRFSNLLRSRLIESDLAAIRGAFDEAIDSIGTSKFWNAPGSEARGSVTVHGRGRQDNCVRFTLQIVMGNVSEVNDQRACPVGPDWELLEAL
jgi:hypothetical protein